MRITSQLTGFSAFAELRFGGRRGRGARRGLLAGEFLLAVAGAEPPGGQHRGEQGDAGGDQEREPVPGDQRVGGVRGARGGDRGQDGQPDRGPGLLAGGEQGPPPGPGLGPGRRR